MVGLLWIIFMLIAIGLVFNVIDWVRLEEDGERWLSVVAITLGSALIFAMTGIFSDARFSPLDQTDLRVGVVYKVLYSDNDLSEDGKKYGGALVLLRWPSVNGGDRRALFKLSRVPPPRFFLSEDGEFISLSSPKE